MIGAVVSRIAAHFQRNRHHAEEMSVAKKRNEVLLRRVAAQESRIKLEWSLHQRKVAAGRQSIRRQERLLRLQEETTKLKRHELERATAQWEQDRLDRKEEAYDKFSRDIALQHWPIAIEPADLREPIAVGERVPVTLLFRGPADLDEQTNLILEDRLRTILSRHFPRDHAERPVRFYATECWKPGAPRRGAIAETLAKHSAGNPTVTMELTRVGSSLVIDVATWGYDPFGVSAPKIGELGRFDWAALLSAIGAAPDRLVEEIAPTIGLGLVTLIDAAHLRRNMVPPAGPAILGELLPGALLAEERSNLVEQMRQQYNQIAAGAPELEDELRLMLGFELSKLEDKTSAKNQAYELCQAWAPALLGGDTSTVGTVGSDVAGTQLEALANLFEESGEQQQAELVHSAATTALGAMPHTLEKDWFVKL